jgi:hypothetical protein
MDKKLQQKLFKKYPKLFRQKDLDMSQTCLCWGICTGNGWYYLLDKICGWLQFNSDHNGHLFPQVEFSQVKEKFGTLRLYHGVINERKPVSLWQRIKKAYECLRWGYVFHDDRNTYYAGEMAGAISFAESLSEDICEDCGKPGKMYNVNGWYLTACPTDLKKYIKHIEKLYGKKAKVRRW